MPLRRIGRAYAPKGSKLHVSASQNLRCFAFRKRIPAALPLTGLTFSTPMHTLRILALALMVAVTASCQRAPTILLPQEVLLRGKAGTPYVIARKPDGGFVVAGGTGATAWAVSTGPQGEVRWQYSEVPEWQGQSEFRGAVTLADGRTLFCGKKVTKQGIYGLVVLVDPDGRVIEQRRVLPSQRGDSWIAADFYRCVPWADGVALLGEATVDKVGLGWLMRLDANGRQEWDKTDSFVATDVVESADHSLVLAGFVNTPQSRNTRRLVRLDASGQKIAEREFRGDSLYIIRPVEPTNSIAAIRHGDEVDKHKDLLLKLDRNLADAAPERILGQYSIAFGCGYLLPDGSVALFGQVGDLRPAIIRVGMQGTGDTVLEYPANLGSFAVRDATPLGPDKFVAVRVQGVTKGVDAHGWAVADEEHSGLVMTWVTMPLLQ